MDTTSVCQVETHDRPRRAGPADDLETGRCKGRGRPVVELAPAHPRRPGCDVDGVAHDGRCARLPGQLDRSFEQARPRCLRRRQPTFTTKHVTAQTDSSPRSSFSASARARSARFPVTRTNEGRGPTRTQPTGVVDSALSGPPARTGSGLSGIRDQSNGTCCRLTWSRSWRLLCRADRWYELPEVTKYWHQHHDGSPRVPKSSTTSSKRSGSRGGSTRRPRIQSSEPMRTHRERPTRT